MYPKHNEDLYGWTTHTVQLLKEKKMDEVDVDGLIEELEEMGISSKHALISRLALIMSHLLKWQFQPNMRGHSWRYTIEVQREDTQLHLEDNPSLKSKLDEIIKKAYRMALSKATKDTGFNKKDFPVECPYTFEQIIDEEFYPQ